ncbi:hypothetical protein KIN20_010587, partial [Parelaphostrongylus tenuis]
LLLSISCSDTVTYCRSPEEGSYRYKLRRRVVSADTDSEDDIPRRKRKVGLGTSKRLLHFDENSQHLETYRIATWLGSIASSFVYYMLYMVHLLIVSVKNSYDGVNRVSLIVRVLQAHDASPPSRRVRRRASIVPSS